LNANLRDRIKMSANSIAAGGYIGASFIINGSIANRWGKGTQPANLGTATSTHVVDTLFLNTNDFRRGPGGQRHLGRRLDGGHFRGQLPVDPPLVQQLTQRHRHPARTALTGPVRPPRTVAWRCWPGPSASTSHWPNCWASLSQMLASTDSYGG
jgi:hypothetical protein